MATLRARKGLGLGDHVHCLWSFSKDFGASGIRIGTLFTQNKSLLKALDMCNNIMMVSNLAQEMCAFVVRDRAFVDLFLNENRKMLRTCFHILQSGLATLGLHVLPASSAIFAFVDLRPLLLLKKSSRSSSSSSNGASGQLGGAGGGAGGVDGARSEASSSSFYPIIDNDCYIDNAEEELEERLIASGLIFTPGRACHCQQRGFFRICYAWMGSIEALHECVRRIGFLVNSHRQNMLLQEEGGKGGNMSVDAEK